MTRSNPSGTKQRRMLAAGTRIRGQWRYHVRTTRDPFGEMPLGAARSGKPLGARGAEAGERLATG